MVARVHFDAESLTPLYQQIADAFADGILSGAFAEETQIPSTTQVAREYQLNPATVLKGMNILVDNGLIEKRRGLGMFVTPGAQAQLARQSKDLFYSEQVTALVTQARALHISKTELLTAIEKGYAK